MINLTDGAVNAAKNAISASALPAGGLRIAVEGGGCAKFKYKMSVSAQADPSDTVIELDGLRVFVDNESHQHLIGTTIDFVAALEGSGFTFNNPNAKSSCSCGRSFNS